MGEHKKYYWLKLKRDFFKRHDIRIIEDMNNGKDYILFYLKLLVESIDHEGQLRFSDTIPYNDKMLSTITNTNIDIIRAAMKIFTELDFIELLDNETIFMRQIEEMTGSETEWAEKKRIYRENNKQIETTERQKKTMSDKSKSLDKELEIDKEEEHPLPVSKLITKSITYWNTKTNLPRCRYTIVNVSSEILRDISSHLTVFKPEEINKAIDNLSEYYEKEDPKFRVNSFQSFATKSIDRWIDEVKPWERYQDDALPDCGPQESTVPKWIKEEGVTFE